jgi:hypothetical protein
MKWDEERYGLEYDLDLFNIVAVDDFNSALSLKMRLMLRMRADSLADGTLQWVRWRTSR